MKLYYFNPNTYGQEYFVMAESKSVALYKVKQYLLKRATDKSNELSEIIMQDYKKYWEGATVDTLPKKYTIDEYDPGQVAETEIS